MEGKARLAGTSEAFYHFCLLFPCFSNSPCSAAVTVTAGCRHTGTRPSVLQIPGYVRIHQLLGCPGWIPSPDFSDDISAHLTASPNPVSQDQAAVPGHSRKRQLALASRQPSGPGAQQPVGPAALSRDHQGGTPAGKGPEPPPWLPGQRAFYVIPAIAVTELMTPKRSAQGGKKKWQLRCN